MANLERQGSVVDLGKYRLESYIKVKELLDKGRLSFYGIYDKIRQTERFGRKEVF